ncbi:hypothetical protein [Litorivivens sp.]|uniref:hypothetical protein n=3 Tax=Litorivivens sp. TaxID=2020868 RepID=UPI003568D552
MSAINWANIVFEQQWMQGLERQAKHRFIEPVTAEEASTFVLEKLAEEDWARCKTYRGNAKPTTFLFSLSARLLEEFSRQRYGRARPPQWLEQQGETWVRLWRALCLERHTTESVVARHSQHDPGVIRNIIRTIKARLPWCGAVNLPVPEAYLGNDESLMPATAFDDCLEQHCLEESLATLSALLGDDDAFVDVHHDAIERARAALTLDDESLLMLKMHFQDGLNFSTIARALGVPNHQPGRQIKRSLQQIHTALATAGLHLRSAADILEDTR